MEPYKAYATAFNALLSLHAYSLGTLLVSADHNSSQPWFHKTSGIEPYLYSWFTFSFFALDLVIYFSSSSHTLTLPITDLFCTGQIDLFLSF